MTKSLNKKIRKLASNIARAEGKKSQVKIGDIREVLKLIATFEAKCIRKDDHWTKFPTYVLADYAANIGAKK